VREAMARCGPPAAAACLAGVTAGIALGFGSRSFIKEFGLGMAVGLVLELLIVEALIAPALLRLTASRPSRQ
jgi:predicted RND superfamily exporter protein